MSFVLFYFVYLNFQVQIFLTLSTLIGSGSSLSLIASVRFSWRANELNEELSKAPVRGVQRDAQSDQLTPRKKIKVPLPRYPSKIPSVAMEMPNDGLDVYLGDYNLQFGEIDTREPEAEKELPRKQMS